MSVSYPLIFVRSYLIFDFFAPSKGLMSCWTVSLKLGAHGKHHYSVNLVPEAALCGLRLPSGTSILPPSQHVCQPLLLQGLRWEHQARRTPSSWAESRVVSLLNQISHHGTRSPRLWWEFFPAMSWVRSYFTVGMLAAPLRKCFFLCPVSLVLSLD